MAVFERRRVRQGSQQERLVLEAIPQQLLCGRDLLGSIARAPLLGFLLILMVLVMMLA